MAAKTCVMGSERERRWREGQWPRCVSSRCVWILNRIEFSRDILSFLSESFRCTCSARWTVIFRPRVLSFQSNLTGPFVSDDIRLIYARADSVAVAKLLSSSRGNRFGLGQNAIITRFLPWNLYIFYSARVCLCLIHKNSLTETSTKKEISHGRRIKSVDRLARKAPSWTLPRIGCDKFIPTLIRARWSFFSFVSIPRRTRLVHNLRGRF